MSTDDVLGCLACDLTHGRQDVPGGRIYETDHWVVEHCVGPLGIGTLIVKPLRHCVHVWELSELETRELGPLLRKTTLALRDLLAPDQVYVNLWSHAGWESVHIHFVVQPVWNKLAEQYEHPGPCMQRDMFHIGELPARDEMEAFAERARDALSVQ